MYNDIVNKNILSAEYELEKRYNHEFSISIGYFKNRLYVCFKRNSYNYKTTIEEIDPIQLFMSYSPEVVADHLHSKLIPFKSSIPNTEITRRRRYEF